MWAQGLEEGLIICRKWKFISGIKRYKTVYYLKSAFKKQKKKAPYLVAWGDHGKTIEVMKELCAKHAPITVVAREIVMAHRSRYLLVRYGDHH